jgi:hypothetical protein
MIKFSQQYALHVYHYTNTAYKCRPLSFDCVYIAFVYCVCVKQKQYFYLLLGKLVYAFDKPR